MALTPEDKKLALKSKYEIEQMIVQKVSAKEPINEPLKKNIIDAIGYFTNFYEMAEKFYEQQPIYYDKSLLWWLWDKEHNKWGITDETDIMILIDQAIRTTPLKTIDSKIKNEILEVLKRYGRQRTPKQPPKHWLQFKNCVIDLNTGDKFKVSSDYFFTNPIPHNIGNSEDTPVIDKLFTDWVGEEKQLLYEIMAYCLYSDYPIHRLFCLSGRGRNGKSKYLELIRRIVGMPNCTSTELDILTSNRFESAKLFKKLVCLMSETNYSTLKSTSLLKKLCGQDFIGYEFKNKNPFDDYNYAKLLIATNSVPSTNDKSDGYYSRWIIVDFPNRFPEGKDILSIIPDVEYENICLKLIRILKELLIKGSFQGEGSIEDKAKKYEEKSNPMIKFLKEKIVNDFEGYIFKRQFKEAINSWMKENGYGYSLSDLEISAHMKGTYEEHKKGSGDTRYWAWCGLNWKENHAKISEDVITGELSVKGVQGGNPLPTDSPIKELNETPLPPLTPLPNYNKLINNLQINTDYDEESLIFFKIDLEKALSDGLLMKTKTGYMRLN